MKTNYRSLMLDTSIPWHNPHNLTPDQVDPEGEGWRLMLKQEIQQRALTDEIQMRHSDHWFSVLVEGSSLCATYRTKWPLPEKYSPKTSTTMNTKYVNTKGQPELQRMIYDLGKFLKLDCSYFDHKGAIALNATGRIDCSCVAHWEARPFFAKEVTVQEFIAALKAAAHKEESVILNDKYTALVSKDGVKVGCQTFPLSVIDALAEAKAKILS